MGRRERRQAAQCLLQVIGVGVDVSLKIVLRRDGLADLLARGPLSAWLIQVRVTLRSRGGTTP